MATSAVTDGLSVRTARGATCAVRAAGPPDGPALVWLHGATGLLDDDRCFDALGRAGYRVLAPELPGYGSSTGEELLEDMLDFTLHGWDVVDALELDHPILAGHSMGGMIVAEMAALPMGCGMTPIRSRTCSACCRFSSPRCSSPIRSRGPLS
jgi:pimeloyl-ACP methyl ester carboxylesterase